MALSTIPLWKEAPFLRLLPPFIAGITLQWYTPLPITPLWLCITASTLGLIIINILSTQARFRLQTITGILLNTLLLLTGSITTFLAHPANNKQWLPTHYTTNQTLRAIIQEPLSKKNKSYKTTASATHLITPDTTINVTGKIILYFSTSIQLNDLSYGSVILVNRQLIPVKNSGNPGAFNYQQHCTFNHISHQVFLKPGDFSIQPGKETRGLRQFITGFRQNIIRILDQYIPNPKENALAEALLIGYKDDLDKDLIQAYANTGVVHVIAISGLHLGIIYWILGLVFKPIARKPAGKWINCILVLAGLWMFSLLAGAGPSVVRSAVMFSFIAIGHASSGRTSIYNNLAASAFLLLCWNPFWLWDVGFQLSYAAVLSIIIFYKPIYNILYVRNKLLDTLWKLCAVTLAAQLLTTPVSIYHFHQFPVFFLLANIIAVPLSSLLLIGEIILCCVSFISPLAAITGEALTFLISLLNRIIEHINTLPFAAWDYLQISLPQFMLLTALVFSLAYSLMHRSKTAFKLSLVCLAGFIALRSHSFIIANQQRKLIIYNVPQKQAIDFVQGRYACFAGDPAVLNDKFLYNFHIKPARILHRAAGIDSLPEVTHNMSLFSFGGKKVLIANASITQLPAGLEIDLLILSQNTRLQLPKLLQTIHVKQVVADASNSPRTLIQWQEACNEMHVPFHNVVDNGAFVLDI